MSPKDKLIEQLREDVPGQSFLSEYINWWSREGGESGPKVADGFKADILETFTSESGLRVLKLMEKAVLLRALPNGADSGALREFNAVRNFVLEIRRLVAHG